MTSFTLITGGTLVIEQDTIVQDLVMAGETIVAIGPNLAAQYPTAQVVEALGCYVIPGGIDPHTHLEMPFMGTTSSDDFETGTRAALFGGTTTIIDFAMQRPKDSLLATYQHWREKAEKSVADYSFHMAITDFTAETPAEMAHLVTNEGIRSFKVFMAYKRALMVGDDTLLNILETAAQLGAKVLAHCEHGDMVDWLIDRAKAQGHTGPSYHALTRPPLVEAEATGRFCDLAQLAGGLPYVVHLSCQLALERVRHARLSRQQQVWVETCIQYLTLDERLYEAPEFEAAKWVFSPPLRSEQDCEALWQALGAGEIDTVATDHCPFCLDQKAAGRDDFSLIPNGMPGVEHRLSLLFSEGVLKGRLTVPQWAAVSSTNAAQIFDLYPRKGVLAVGSDGDVVIFDPAVTQILSQTTHHMRCDYSAFEGRQVTGQVRQVWRRGELAIDVTKQPDHCYVERGSGRYLRRFLP